MFYPTLNHISKNREMVTVFRGLNDTYSCTLGEWAKEHGLSSDLFPAFSPETISEKRESKNYSEASYMAANGIILSVEDSKLYAETRNGRVKAQIPAELYQLASARNFFLEMGNKALLYQVTHTVGDLGENQGNDLTAVWMDKTKLEEALSGEEDPENVLKKDEAWGYIKGTPILDFVFEHKNRIWGCRYGTQPTKNTETGEVSFPFVNEIYASELGSYENWRTYEGISTDSYAASVGTGAEFTGAIAYNDDPIFFKSDRMYRVSGDYPAEFVISEIECPGVSKSGGWSTLKVLNGMLFYLSADGIYSYAGGLPERISDNLGYRPKLYGYCAHAFNGKYYIAYSVGAGEREEVEGITYKIATFDAERGIWHTSDYEKSAVSIFGRESNEITADFGNYRLIIGSKYESCRSDWYAESGDLGLSYPDGKRISRIKIRAELDEGARFDVFMQYDRDGYWKHEGAVNGTPDGRLQTFTVSNIPRRCDTYRIKISGMGKCVILSITNDIEQGGN